MVSTACALTLVSPEAGEKFRKEAVFTQGVESLPIAILGFLGVFNTLLAGSAHRYRSKTAEHRHISIMAVSAHASGILPMRRDLCELALALGGALRIVLEYA